MLAFEKGLVAVSTIHDAFVGLTIVERDELLGCLHVGTKFQFPASHECHLPSNSANVAACSQRVWGCYMQEVTSRSNKSILIVYEYRWEGGKVELWKLVECGAKLWWIVGGCGIS